VPSFARLECSKTFLQRYDFFFFPPPLCIKVGTETDVADFFIQEPYDTNAYSMLQKLIITQLLCMNLYSFIVLKSILP